MAPIWLHFLCRWIARGKLSTWSPSGGYGSSAARAWCGPGRADKSDFRSVPGRGDGRPRQRRHVTATSPAPLRALTTRIAVSAAAIGVLLVGLQIWIVPAPSAGASTPVRIFAQAYNQPTFYGPGRVPVATGQPSVAQYQLQRIQMSSKGRTDVFSLTITGSNASVGLPRFPPDRTITPELNLVKDPALTAASPSDTCGNNCTFNLTQTPSGW